MQVAKIVVKYSSVGGGNWVEVESGVDYGDNARVWRFDAGTDVAEWAFFSHVRDVKNPDWHDKVFDCYGKPFGLKAQNFVFC